LAELGQTVKPNFANSRSIRDRVANICCFVCFRKEGARDRVARLRERGIIVDFREPDIIRLAPVPLYSNHRDLWRAVNVLKDYSKGVSPR